MLNNNFNQNSFSFQNFSAQFSQQAQNLRDKKVFDQFSAKQDKVTCDTPRGHLIRESLPQEFGSMIVDNVKDVKNLGSALKDGKGTDTQLGRLNDLGMKVGGGVIAAALMGKRATKNKKLMEAIGFGTFFSVMSLWPKVAIDAPTKLLRGFNPHQKYIDSNGDKKPFFLDNQYLSWDMWSKEEIDKIGDKMNVPKDIEDRQEYTKEKMRTIAMQDNTLWMLTAGISTPLLTSLACNKIEEGLRVPLANMSLRNIADQVKPENTEKLVQKALNSDGIKANDKIFEGVIKSLRQGVVPENMDQTITRIFDLTAEQTSGTKILSESFKKTNTNQPAEILSKITSGKELDFSGLARTLASGDTDENVEKLQKMLEKGYMKARQNQMNSVPSPDDIWKTTSRIISKGVKNGEFDDSAKWVQALLSGEVEEFGDKFKAGVTSLPFSKKACSEIADGLETVYHGTIRPAQARFKVMGDQLKELGNISGERYNLFARKLLKNLSFSDDEIAKLRNTATIDEQMDMISQKLKGIVTDKDKFESVKQSLVQQRDKVEKTGSSIIPGRSKEISIGSVFDSIVDSADKGLKKLGLSSAVESSITDNTGLQKILKEGVSGQDTGKIRASISSVDAMLSRTFAMLELESKIQDGSLLEEYKQNCSKLKVPCTLDAASSEPKAVKALEDFYVSCRKMVWGSSYSDVMNKFQHQGNTDSFVAKLNTVFSPSSDARADIWKQMIKSVASETDFVPNDALKFSYTELAKQEIERISGRDAAQDTKLVEQKTSELFGFTKGLGEVYKTDATKFADLGEATVSTLKNQANQLYNDKLWMKRFGVAAGVLTGVTLLSQLFFGKVKDGNLYKKQNQQDTFVSGK